jgi:hypothetical protein
MPWRLKTEQELIAPESSGKRDSHQDRSLPVSLVETLSVQRGAGFEEANSESFRRGSNPIRRIEIRSGKTMPDSNQTLDSNLEERCQHSACLF